MSLETPLNRATIARATRGGNVSGTELATASVLVRYPSSMDVIPPTNAGYRMKIVGITSHARTTPGRRNARE